MALAGGANAAQQYLVSDRVDEMEINLVPTLLGSGERLFDSVGGDLRGLELIRTVATPRVTRNSLPGATHTFSRREWRDQVAAWTTQWLGV